MCDLCVDVDEVESYIEDDGSEEGTDIPERVAAGVALLDEWRADWRERINWDVLDIADGDECIVGQLFEGAYSDGLEELGISVPAFYGLDGYSYEYADLRDEWRKYATVTAR